MQIPRAPPLTTRSARKPRRPLDAELMDQASRDRD
jgi:hypothetical protein